MKLVIDANILFSALIKDSTTRRLILNDFIVLYSPDFLIREFLEHIGELQDKAKVDRILLKEKFIELLRLANIKLFSKDYFNDSIKKALKFSPDVGDVPYFALALKLNCPIWSNDKDLKKQNVVKIYSTEELIYDIEFQ